MSDPIIRSIQVAGDHETLMIEKQAYDRAIELLRDYCKCDDQLSDWDSKCKICDLLISLGEKTPEFR